MTNVVKWIWSLILSLFNKKQEQEKKQDTSTKITQNVIGSKDITLIGVQNNYKN